MAGDQWHIDGMRFHNNIGICKFSVLCGFVLSNWTHPWMGNFVVWPKTHLETFTMIQALGGAEGFLKRVEASPKKTPCVWDSGTHPAKWIIAKPGDMIICHPMLPHRAGLLVCWLLLFCFETRK